MTHRESKVDKVENYIDTEYSCGDSARMTKKQPCQEENNNEVDELSKELAEMGCIVDTVKRPPNICVETCVYEEASESGDDDKSKPNTYELDEEVYSDEFEPEEIDDDIEPEIKSVHTESERDGLTDASNKVIKNRSMSSMSANRPPESISGRTTGYGSISVPPHTKRINMSFPNDRLREIERHNHILLRKILSVRNSKKTSLPPRDIAIRKPVPPAAVQRKLQQRKIDHENMILLKKIQRAKSSSYSVRR